MVGYSSGDPSKRLPGTCVATTVRHQGSGVAYDDIALMRNLAPAGSMISNLTQMAVIIFLAWLGFSIVRA